MPATVSPSPTRRKWQPYTTTFRNFSPERRLAELAALKEMYEKDRLSIRQIAEQKQASYCFMRDRLREAGVDLAANSTHNGPPRRARKPAHPSRALHR
jgi:hypothetical protein